MNSVLFFVQIILLSQLVLSRYECNDQGYKDYLNDLTAVKKGFVGHKEDVGLPGDWIPTKEKYEEYWIGLILKVDIWTRGKKHANSSLQSSPIVDTKWVCLSMLILTILL